MVAALPTVARGTMAHTEDEMQDMWIGLMTGFVLGAAIGYAHAWRLARKLEAHRVTLREWDMDDWREAQTRAALRLRGPA